MTPLPPVCNRWHGARVTPQQREALEYLIRPEQRTGHDERDLVTALKHAGAAVADLDRARHDLLVMAGAVALALRAIGRRRRPAEWAWRAIEAETGIPYSTVRHWTELHVTTTRRKA